MSEESEHRRNRMLPFTEEQARLITVALVFLAAVAVGAVLHFAATIMIPFVFAIFIMAVMSPVLGFFEIRLRFPHPVAVACTLLVIGGAGFIFGVVTVSIMQTLVQTVQSYNSSMNQLLERLIEPLIEIGLPLDATQITEDLRRSIPQLNSRSVDAVRAFVAQSVLTIILVGFLLAGHDPRQIRVGVLGEIDTRIRKFLIIKVIISALTGVAVWGIFWLMGLPFAPVFGMLAFVLNFIPAIGSIIATVLPLPIALSHFDSLGAVTMAILLPGAVQMTMGNVIEPKLMGQGMNLHPVTVIVALAFWGILWGPIGMVLAVPLTAVIRFVLLEFETTRGMADVMAGHLASWDQWSSNS